jgi:hypothetical protein
VTKWPEYRVLQMIPADGWEAVLTDHRLIRLGWFALVEVTAAGEDGGVVYPGVGERHVWGFAPGYGWPMELADSFIEYRYVDPRAGCGE